VLVTFPVTLYLTAPQSMVGKGGLSCPSIPGRVGCSKGSGIAKKRYVGPSFFAAIQLGTKHTPAYCWPVFTSLPLTSR
jgi:hypothetical protein